MFNNIFYLNDGNGSITAVQIPIQEWEKILSEMKKYRRLLGINKDLTTAFKEVELMQQGKSAKQTLSELINEL